MEFPRSAKDFAKICADNARRKHPDIDPLLLAACALLANYGTILTTNGDDETELASSTLTTLYQVGIVLDYTFSNECSANLHELIADVPEDAYKSLLLSCLADMAHGIAGILLNSSLDLDPVHRAGLTIYGLLMQLNPAIRDAVVRKLYSELE